VACPYGELKPYFKDTSHYAMPICSTAALEIKFNSKVLRLALYLLSISRAERQRSESHSTKPTL